MKNIKLIPFMIFIVSLVVTYILINNLKIEKIKDTIEFSFEHKSSNLNTILTTLIEEKQKSTLNISLSMAQNENIIKSLKTNNPKILNLDILSKRFRKYSEYKNLWFQIINKDGYSFSRSWTNKNGDYMINSREDLQELFKNPKQSTHISVGKFDLTFKSIIPIYDEQSNFLGFFETISHFNSISNKFNKEGIDSVFLADRKYKKQLKYPFTKKFIGDYYVANLNANDKIIDYLKRGQIVNYVEQFLLKDYFIDKGLNKLVVYKQLFNIKNESMAHLMIFYPLDNFSISQIEEIKNIYNVYIIIVFFIIIVIALIFYLNSFKNEKESIGNQNLIIILFIIYLLLVSAIYFILNYGVNKHVNGHLISQKSKIANEYNLIYQKNKDISNFIFSSHINTSEIKELLVKKNRDGLYKYLKNNYTFLKEKYNIKQLHFHNKDTSSFLRMHQPKNYADDLKKTRPSVLFVNEKLINYDGFEVGKTYGSYRFIFPLYLKDTHIGSVDISFDTYSILKQFHTSLTHDNLSFLIRKDTLEKKLSSIDSSTYKQSPLMQFLFDKRLLQKMKSEHMQMKINEKSYSEKILIEKLILKGKPFTISLESANEIITGIPILNKITQEVVATIQISTDNDSVREVYDGLYIVLSIISIILGLIMVYIYKQISSNYKLLLLNIELKNNHKVLKESVDNFQNLLDTTTQMIVIFNKNREIKEINKSGITILGYEDKNELIDKNILDFVYHMDLPIAKEAIKKELDTPYELRLMNYHGKILTTIVSAKNIIRDGQEMRMASMMDITELKEKEAIFQQQSRLAQMGEMISMIAHQWRQPLGAISTAVFGIQTKLNSGRFDLDNKDDRDKFLKIMDKKHSNINNYVQSLSETIDDFRNFFKPSKLKEKVDINVPIIRALNIVKVSMTNKGILINKNFTISNEIYVYQNEIMQVVLNILKNCEDNFIERNVKNGTISISTKKNNDDYIILIRDNGGGIPSDILPKIFDPYYSTKDEKNGTGLGLYMSKIMIEEHNEGILSVSNTEDGVEFKIVFNKSINDLNKEENKNV